jgi:hypothetical protein
MIKNLIGVMFALLLTAQEGGIQAAALKKKSEAVEKFVLSKDNERLKPFVFSDFVHPAYQSSGYREMCCKEYSASQIHDQEAQGKKLKRTRYHQISQQMQFFQSINKQGNRESSDLDDLLKDLASFEIQGVKDIIFGYYYDRDRRHFFNMASLSLSYSAGSFALSAPQVFSMPFQSGREGEIEVKAEDAKKFELKHGSGCKRIVFDEMPKSLLPFQQGKIESNTLYGVSGEGNESLVVSITEGKLPEYEDLATF